MNTQISVDSSLLEQAMQTAHFNNSHILVESLLRLLIEKQGVAESLGSHTTQCHDWERFFSMHSAFGDDFLSERECDIAQERDF